MNQPTRARMAPDKRPRIVESPGPASEQPVPTDTQVPWPDPPSIPAPRADRWPVRGSILLGVISIAVLVWGFGLWATQSRISSAVVANGQIEVDRQRQVVQHPDGGIVQQIAVSEGQYVEAGQTLIHLDGGQLRPELGIVESQYYEILARRGRLEAERSAAAEIVFPDPLVTAGGDHREVADLMEGQRRFYQLRTDSLRHSKDQLSLQLDQIASQIDGIEAQIAAMAVQQDLIAKELTDQETLFARGLAQASRVLALQREAARIDGQLGELRASRASAGIRQSELQVQRLHLDTKRREEAEAELRDLEFRELELTERRRGLIDRIARLDIRAPASGRVYDLQVTTPNSVIRAADPLMYIVPQDRPLVVAARIATFNITDIQIGQPAMLRFPSFSARNSPEIEGHLSRISADALSDERTHAPYYLAEITITPAALKTLGDQQLVPGMPVEVYIRTGERSPMAYLLKPLTDYFSRSFREN